MTRVTVHASRAQVRRVLQQVPAILSGRQADPTGIVRQLLLATGMVAMSLIREAFVAKARGGTDAAGDRWAPLARRYVAYGRRHPGLKRKRRGERPRGLLTDEQDARWRRLYASGMKRFARESDPGGHAAAWAWTVLKAEGAATILDRYGDAPTEVNRDTGRLLNSFSPGVPDAILQADPGRVVVGTNVQYAPHVHARRRLWPEPARWPAAWWGEIGAAARQGVLHLVLRLLGAA